MQQIKQKKIMEKTKAQYYITLPLMHGIGVIKRKLEKLKIKIIFSYPNNIPIKHLPKQL
jgi:hypothetical protein